MAKENRGISECWNSLKQETGITMTVQSARAKLDMEHVENQILPGRGGGNKEEISRLPQSALPSNRM